MKNRLMTAFAAAMFATLAPVAGAQAEPKQTINIEDKVAAEARPTVEANDPKSQEDLAKKLAELEKTVAALETKVKRNETRSKTNSANYRKLVNSFESAKKEIEGLKSGAKRTAKEIEKAKDVAEQLKNALEKTNAQASELAEFTKCIQSEGLTSLKDVAAKAWQYFGDWLFDRETKKTSCNLSKFLPAN